MPNFFPELFDIKKRSSVGFMSLLRKLMNYISVIRKVHIEDHISAKNLPLN